MSNAIITFPLLGDRFSFSAPPTYELFGLTLRWYGLIIAVGFVLAIIYCSRRCADFGITPNELLDMLLWAFPLAIIGARLYWFIFNGGSFADIFKIWNGGLAIYGGIIGAIIGVFIFCRRRRIPPGAMLDAGCFGLLIGQAVGRWGNFINREAYGGETSVFCRMGLTDPATGATIYVHPAFLYESLWNLLGLALLHVYSKKKKRRYDGELFTLYVAWYGLGRMLIEGLRVDSLYLFDTGIRVSQLLAGLSMAAALVFLWFKRRRSNKAQPLWEDRKKESCENAGNSSSQ